MGQVLAREAKRTMRADTVLEKDQLVADTPVSDSSGCWEGCFAWAKPQPPVGPYAVVVDPYSSGRFLLYELHARRMPIVCVRSSLELGAFFLNAYHKNKAYFAHTIDHRGLDSTVAELRALPGGVAAVFGGSEPGVQLADELAEALGLEARNATALTRARKDKAEMQERLRECGVPAARQARSGSLPELLAWAETHGDWPLVAKPTGSSGSDGIFFCQGPDDVAAAYEELIGKMNPNGLVNSELALQEFLAGTEYIVDTVSHAGKHLCVAIWVYTKRKGVPWNPHCIVSEGNRLLPSSGGVQDVLTEYAFRVLDAVGLAYGPCHTEIMMTPRGPILVEVNARLHGLQGPHLIGLATGTSKAAYAVDALVDGGRLFAERQAAAAKGCRYEYPLQRDCLQLVLISPVSGFLKVPITKAIQRLGLASVVEVLPSVQKGQWLSQTCDLNSAAGYVLLVHASGAQIDADRARIRAAEESGELYAVSPEPLPQSPACSPGGPWGLASPSPPPSPRLQSLEKAEEVWVGGSAGADAAAGTPVASPAAAAIEMSGF